MSLRILMNDTALVVEPGITILEAARRNNIYIPTLCDFPGLPSRGSCRLCIVDIQGKPNTPTACTTPVEEGMVIHTNSPKIHALRGELLQMLLSEHPSGCLFCPEKEYCQDCMVTLRKASATTGCRSCPKDSQCELQDMIDQSGLGRVGYIGRYRMLKIEKNDPFYDRDYNLCILCGRCIRICDDLHFSSTLTYIQRGSETVVGTAFNRSHIDAGCSFCGACVEACPTGSLMEKTRKWDGKAEVVTQSTCPFCSIGCQIDILSKNDELIGTLPNQNANANNLCVKGRFGATELVNHVSRIKHPQIREGHEFRRASWEDAIRVAAEKIGECPPESFMLSISASSCNEDLFVARKFTHRVAKSTKVYSSAWTRYGEGSRKFSELLLRSQGLNVLSDASAILALGFDGRYAQSVVEVDLHKAKKRGARILSIFSPKHALSQYADVWLRPTDGRESELIEALTSLLKSHSDASLIAGSGDKPHSLNSMASELAKADKLVVVVGPAFLTNPDNLRLLAAIEALVEFTQATLVLLPEQANLRGSIQQGIPQHQAEQPIGNPGLLFLIGEGFPKNLTGSPFILYHNIYPPETGTADIVFPAAAFSETDGTLTDQAGLDHRLNRAVPLRGESKPAWQVLSEIAQYMGMDQFAYTCIEDVQAEMWKAEPGIKTEETMAAHPGKSLWAKSQIGEHHYMGFSLAKPVEGLQMLYPEETIR